MFDRFKLVVQIICMGRFRKKMVDWKKKTLEQWEQINSAAARRFGDNSLAEEAALAVMEGLEINDWQRVRGYSGRGSFSSYIMTLTGRLLEDFSRSRFGRVRPPLWVKTMGGIWNKLFIALCLERLKVSEAVEVVFQRQFTAEKKEIEDAAYTLLGRIPNCGITRGYEVEYDETCHEKTSSGAFQQGDRVEEDEGRRMLKYLFQTILDREEKEISEKTAKKLHDLKVHLQPQEKMLLKLCFQDGLGVAAAGRLLGQTRYQAHGRMRRIMSRIRKEFERTGLDRELRLFLRS
jgi:RNA polymerase sigma factor (sigma-70 family)